MSWEKLNYQNDDKLNMINLEQKEVNVNKTENMVEINNLKYQQFDANSILYDNWSSGYYQKGIDADWSEDEIINNLIHFFSEDLKLVINQFPKDVIWSTYNERISELFRNQLTNLINFKKYVEYENFLDFFSDKLRILNHKKFDESAKRDAIFELLDSRFKNSFALTKINEMKLYEFAIICSDLENSFGWYCPNCKSTTHWPIDCPKTKRVEKSAFQNYLQKSLQFINVNHLVLCAFVFLSLFIWYIGFRYGYSKKVEHEQNIVLSLGTNIKNYLSAIELPEYLKKLGKKED